MRHLRAVLHVAMRLLLLIAWRREVRLVDLWRRRVVVGLRVRLERLVELNALAGLPHLRECALLLRRMLAEVASASHLQLDVLDSLLEERLSAKMPSE